MAGHQGLVIIWRDVGGDLVGVVQHPETEKPRVSPKPSHNNVKMAIVHIVLFEFKPTVEGNVIHDVCTLIYHL